MLSQFIIGEQSYCQCVCVCVCVCVSGEIPYILQSNLHYFLPIS